MMKRIRMSIAFVLIAFLYNTSVSYSQELCLVGDAEDISELGLQEQIAYEWAMEFYGEEVVYRSFNEIVATGLPQECRRIWFHYAEALNLPSDAFVAASVVEAFLNNGRNGILLTGSASKYVTAINITSVGPNEEKLAQNSSIDTWGVRPVPGQENHPIFNNMELTSDWINPAFNGYRTVSEGMAAPEVWAWWVQGTFPGERIGTMPWLTDANITPIGALNKGSDQGGALVVSLPGFCWVQGNGATEQANLEQFTRNCIEYLYPWPSPEDVEMGELAMHFSFDVNENNTAFEAVESKDYPIISNWPAERVTGVHGDGLRIDGYTTYLEGQFNASYFSDKHITFSAWIAIETFPTGQDGGLQLGSVFSNDALEVSVTSQGKIFVNIANGGQITSAQVLNYNEWIHLAVTIDEVNGVMKLFKNGQEIGASHVSGVFDWSNRSFWIGKHRSDALYAGFNINHFNGIIDEVKIYNKILSQDELLAEFSYLPTGVPDLSIPESRYQDDLHRPRYHPIAATGWVNEPHGLIFYNGKYHMFFQKNGNGPYWSSLHWGVLTSPDLVNWTEEPPVLRPDVLTAWDRRGIWSGGALLDDNNNPIIYYTGVDGGKAGIGVATLDANKVTWTKSLSNPVIATKPAVSSDDFRDPFVWKEGAYWFMMVGGSYNGKGTAWLYRSSDMYNWTYLRPLMTNATGDVGSFWEMPVMLKMNGKHVFIAGKTPDATRARTFYWVGEFVNDNFIADHTTPIDVDLILGALSPTISFDNQNRFVGIAIIPDTWNAFLDDASEHKSMGWANSFTLPKVWTLNNGKIHRKPLPELASLRNQEKLVNKNSVTFSPGQTGILDNVHGRRLEIQLTIDPEDADRVGVVLGKGSNGELTRIYFDYALNRVVVDRSNSSLNPNAQKYQPGPASYSLNRSEKIDLRIFIDHSIIEVFINEKDAFVTRIFPIGEDSDGIDLFVEGGSATATDISVWELNALATVNLVQPENVREANSFVIYPNPANAYLNIKGDLPRNENVNFDVISLGGHILKRKMVNFEGNYSLDIQNLDPGVYILSITSDKWQQQILFLKK